MTLICSLQDLVVVLIQMQQAVHVLRLQKNPKHDGLITTVGHIAESDSGVQCYILKVSYGSIGLPVRMAGIQLVVVYITDHASSNCNAALRG